MGRDTELTPELARVVVRVPGEYRFALPKSRRACAYDWLKRYKRAAGTTVRTRTDGDTMWVTVSA